MEYNEKKSVTPFRVLPDTCVELFISYVESPVARLGTGTEKLRSFVVFRMSRFMDVEMERRAGCIAICFHPGAAYNFFSFPMNEVSDTVTDLNYLWKDIASELEEKVFEATNNHERVNIIQQYLHIRLVKKIRTDKAIEQCLWQINYLKGQLSAKQLSEKINISQRQLSRRFNSYVGITPKEFIRTNRFMYSLKHLKKYPAINLTEIAYESGYYDQAHFIRECKEFSGLTPGELIASENIIYCL
jgi:AraC-like DNA-binding protein